MSTRSRKRAEIVEALMWSIATAVVDDSDLSSDGASESVAGDAGNRLADYKGSLDDLTGRRGVDSTDTYSCASTTGVVDRIFAALGAVDDGVDLQGIHPTEMTEASAGPEDEADRS